MIFLHEIEEEILRFPGDWQPNEMYYSLDDDNLDTFLEETKAVGAGGYFSVPGAEQIVRAYMERRNLTVLEMSVHYRLEGTQEGTSYEWKHGIKVLYTAGNIRKAGTVTADGIASSQFLTTADCVFLYKNQQYQLQYYIESGEEIYTLGTYYRDGRVTNNGTKIGAGLGSQRFSYLDDVAKYVVYLGSRQFTIYMMDDTPCEVITFRNFFNAQDGVLLPCSIERNPSTEYETASVGRVSISYDVEHKEEFTLRSALLHTAMADQLLWMVRSRSVSYKEKKGSAEFLVDIIIKDYKIIRSTEPNTPITFEMTFEYADTRLPSTLTL